MAVTRAKNRAFDEVGSPSFDVLNLLRFILHGPISFHEDVNTQQMFRNTHTHLHTHDSVTQFWLTLAYLACLCDQVTTEEDGVLAHPTRDRAKIPYSRRLPTRGHLLAVVPTVLSVNRW